MPLDDLVCDFSDKHIFPQSTPLQSLLYRCCLQKGVVTGCHLQNVWSDGFFLGLHGDDARSGNNYRCSNFNGYRALVLSDAAPHDEAATGSLE